MKTLLFFGADYAEGAQTCPPPGLAPPLPGAAARIAAAALHRTHAPLRRVCMITMLGEDAARSRSIVSSSVVVASPMLHADQVSFAYRSEYAARRR